MLTTLALILLGILLLLLGLVLWNALAWPGLHRPPADASRLSVLIPARNEEHNLPHLLESLVRQAPAPLEIIVCDDLSTDGTAGVVRRFAAANPRLRLMSSTEPHEGWGGKTFACARLAEQARGEWLLFLDADVTLAPDALGRALAEAQGRDCTFLACWPGVEMRSFWERLFMPMLNFVVFTLFPAPLALHQRRPSLGLAHGACLLMRRAEYERVGGHASVRGELFEDTALARVWREANLHGICLDGQHAVRVRMYASLGAIWRGFQKIIYPAFRRDLSFWLFLAFHAAVFLLPFVLLAIPGPHRPYAAAAAGTVLLMRFAQILRFRYPWWSALLHPVAETALLALGVSAWAQCHFGGGVSWKGRRYFANGRRGPA